MTTTVDVPVAAAPTAPAPSEAPTAPAAPEAPPVPRPRGAEAPAEAPVADAPVPAAPEADALPAVQVSAPVHLATGTRVRLAVRGDLDRPAGRRLVAQVQHAADEGAERVVLDLSGVTAMEGIVVRDLLWQDWKLAHHGGSLRLARPNRQVHRALRFFGAGHLVVR